MKRGFVKSSPHFFRLIKIAMALLVLVLLVLAALAPAPLQQPANIALVPNPVKSAWFLLWIQELVSYSKYLIYGVLALVAACTLLPWLSGEQRREAAEWFGRSDLKVSIVALLVFFGMCALTIVGLYFRGENWSLVLPF